MVLGRLLAPVNKHQHQTAHTLTVRANLKLAIVSKNVISLHKIENHV